MRPALVVTLAVLAAAGAAAGARSAATARACTLASPAQIRTLLGLSQSTFERNYDNTSPASGARNTQCGIGLWSGPAPGSKQQAFAAAAGGRAAQVGIETWAPHEGSSGLSQWLDRDYDKLTGGFEIGGVVFPGLLSAKGIPSRKLAVPKLAGGRAGLVLAVPGTAGRISAAVGCWWSDRAHAALCMFVESGGRIAVAGRLAALAKIVVPRFFASP